MRVFNVDFKKLAASLLPVRLRKLRMLSWLSVLIAPTIWLYGRFRSNRDKNLYRIRHGQHVAHLEAALNDKWDMGMRRIKVADAPVSYQPLFLYRQAENKPAYFYRQSENKPVTLWSQDEVMFGGIDFVVNVPVSIPYDVDEMTALVKDYKTPGTGFMIQDI